MVAFGLVNDENHEWPPFAASIIIELWRNPDFKSQKNDDTSKYTIKFYYCTEVRKRDYFVLKNSLLLIK